MSQNTKRIRMFAGPNGSGKTTIKKSINSDLFGIYINPDDIEQSLKNNRFLDLKSYSVHSSQNEVLKFFTDSAFLKQVHLHGDALNIQFKDDKLIFHDIDVNAYFAAVIADYIRTKLLETNQSFSFETVMSYPDKIEFLQKAQKKGFRTYLYYVATEDPMINILRVKNRVTMGGHPVPEDKIISRYHRSLDLLRDAVQFTNRAYIFDNSGREHLWIAEITNGKELEMKASQMPCWFKKALWDKLVSAENQSI